MDGVAGLRGWRWVFILEGLLTCVVAVPFWFLLPDFPEDAKWLSDDNKAYVKARLEVDQGKSGLDRAITPKDIANVFKDYKVIIGGFMYFGLIVPVTSTCSSLILLLIPIAGIWIRLFLSNYHQNSWILPHSNATSYGTPVRCCIRILSDGRLGV